MATKIKLMRMGKMRAPYYRMVVADSRTKRDGRSIETIGKYHPKDDPSVIEVNSERVQYWLSVGAQPTEPVAAILRVTGDWQQFKGEPAPPPMLMKAAKADKRMAFEAAALQGSEGGMRPATTPRKKAEPKPDATAEPKTEAPPSPPVAQGGSDAPAGAPDQPATAAEAPDSAAQPPPPAEE